MGGSRSGLAHTLAAAGGSSRSLARTLVVALDKESHGTRTKAAVGGSSSSLALVALDWETAVCTAVPGDAAHTAYAIVPRDREIAAMVVAS